MPLTLGNLVDMVQDEFSNDYLTDARVKDKIGLVVRKIHRMTEFVFLKTEGTFDTVASQADYDFNMDAEARTSNIQIDPTSFTDGTNSPFGDFNVDDVITVEGSKYNDGQYTLTSATSTTIACSGESFTSESAGNQIRITSSPAGISNLDAHKTIRIRPPSTTYREVQYLDYQQFYEAWPSWQGTQEGDPINWTWAEWKILRFNPIPTGVGTYTVAYYKEMIEIDNTTSDATTLDIPDKYSDVVLVGAQEAAAGMLDDDRMAKYNQDFTLAKMRMLKDLFPQRKRMKPDIRMMQR